MNWRATRLTDQERARQLSDQYLLPGRDLRPGAWMTRRGKRIGTQIGHDIALVIMSGSNEASLTVMIPARDQ